MNMKQARTMAERIQGRSEPGPVRPTIIGWRTEQAQWSGGGWVPSAGAKGGPFTVPILERKATKITEPSRLKTPFRAWARIVFAGRDDLSPKLARVVGGRS